MPWLDSRVPVRLTADDKPNGAAMLIEGEHFSAAQDHEPGCTCCAARNSAGRALAALLQDRARGKVAFFHSVIAVTHTQAGRDQVLAALQTDPVAGACFRLADADG